MTVELSIQSGCRSNTCVSSTPEASKTQEGPCFTWSALQWRHNGRDSISNHQSHDCLLSRLFRRRSRKTSKIRATGLCTGKSPGTGEFPAQMTSYAEHVSNWWRHHAQRIPMIRRLSQGCDLGIHENVGSFKPELPLLGHDGDIW